MILVLTIWTPAFIISIFALLVSAFTALHRWSQWRHEKQGRKGKIYQSLTLTPFKVSNKALQTNLGIRFVNATDKSITINEIQFKIEKVFIKTNFLGINKKKIENIEFEKVDNNHVVPYTLTNFGNQMILNYFINTPLMKKLVNEFSTQSIYQIYFYAEIKNSLDKAYNTNKVYFNNEILDYINSPNIDLEHSRKLMKAMENLDNNKNQ